MHQNAFVDSSQHFPSYGGGRKRIKGVRRQGREGGGMNSWIKACVLISLQQSPVNELPRWLTVSQCCVSNIQYVNACLLISSLVRQVQGNISDGSNRRNFCVDWEKVFDKNAHRNHVLEPAEERYTSEDY